MAEARADQDVPEADRAGQASPAPTGAAAARRSFIEERRRIQIIDAGIELLAEGYAAASMHKIARHVGISTGVISYHFGNKANLIDAITQHIVTTAVDHMLPKILGSPTAREGLRALIISNLEYMADYPLQLQALVQIIRHDLSGSGPGAYSAQPTQSVLDVEKVLVWGQSTGEFGDFDTRVMAGTVRAAIDYVPTLLAAQPDLDLPAYAEELANLFERTTRADPPHPEVRASEAAKTPRSHR